MLRSTLPGQTACCLCQSRGDDELSDNLVDLSGTYSQLLTIDHLPAFGELVRSGPTGVCRVRVCSIGPAVLIPYPLLHRQQRRE